MFPIRDRQNSKSFPFINLGLIAINIYVFLRELISPDIETLINEFALISADVNFSNSQTLAPFVTSMFLHAGFLHIISNMWFLWVFGDNVEAKIGHLKYLVFYLFCGITAGFIQYLLTIDSSIPMLGASGAVAGILGAYLKFFPKNSVDTLIPLFGILPLVVAVPAGFMLVYWFFIQTFNSVASVTGATVISGGVAYFAHAGGFAAGFVFSRFFVWQRQVQAE